MTTSETLGEEFIRTEIEKIQNRIELYINLYENSPVKCLTLKRLIAVKEAELNLLYTLV